MEFKFRLLQWAGLARACWLFNFNTVRKLGVSLVVLAAIVLQGCSTVQTETENHALSGQSADRLFVLIGEADAAYQRNQWEDASALYQEVLSLVPEDPYAWFRLGNSLTQAGQYYKAIFAYETSLQHDSLQTKPWFNLSTAHILGAQLATMKALNSMGVNDVAKADMQIRMNTLSALLP